jgi:archaellum biogenesis ATPase FlaH
MPLEPQGLRVVPGGEKAKAKVEPYGLALAFEQAVAALCCQRPRFWETVGHAIDPAALGSAAGRLALEAVRACSVDYGQGPDNPVLVVQRLARWREEGTVTTEQIREVVDALEEAADRGLPSDEAAAAEMVPVLRRRAEGAAVRKAIDVYGKRKDLAPVVEDLQAAQRLGIATGRLGHRLGPAAYDMVRNAQHLSRLPLGISELDTELEGGIAEKCIALIAGAGGVGKSILCVHASGSWLELGLFVAVATYEVSTIHYFARLMATLTGIPTNGILDGRLEEAEAKVASLRLPGVFRIDEFAPGSGSPEALQAWVERMEAEEHRPLDVLIVDYLDKVGRPGKEHQAPNHEKITRNMELLSGWVQRKPGMVGKTGGPRWILSPTHLKNKNARGRRGGVAKDQHADVDDFSGSSGKGRDMDVGIVMVKDDAGILFTCPKNRFGPQGFSVGPLPCDLSCAQVAPVVRHGPLPF